MSRRRAGLGPALLLALALPGAASGCAASGTPSWLVAGSGARHGDTGPGLAVLAIVRGARPTDVQVAAELRAQAVKLAKRWVVHFGAGDPARGRLLPDDEAGRRRLEQLRDRLAAEVAPVARWEGEDGLYVAGWLPLPRAMETLRAEPDGATLAAWAEAAFRRLEAEDARIAPP